jgi:hypothetical protein
MAKAPFDMPPDAMVHVIVCVVDVLVATVVGEIAQVPAPSATAEIVGWLASAVSEPPDDDFCVVVNVPTCAEAGSVMAGAPPEVSPYVKTIVWPEVPVMPSIVTVLPLIDSAFADAVPEPSVV